MAFGWRLHRHHRGPQFLIDTTNTGWILLSGQNWIPLLGHQWVLFHGHGQTGGALKAASPHLAYTFILAHGDTFSYVEYSDLLGLLDRNTLSLSLVKVADGARYGSAITDGRHVVGFREKGLSGPCLVNAGVYGCRRGLISELPTQSSFSFEVDFLEPRLALLRPQFHQARSGMIDIGAPESYAFANLIFGKGRS